MTQKLFALSLFIDIKGGKKSTKRELYFFLVDWQLLKSRSRSTARRLCFQMLLHQAFPWLIVETLP